MKVWGKLRAQETFFKQVDVPAFYNLCLNKWFSCSGRTGPKVKVLKHLSNNEPTMAVYHLHEQLRLAGVRTEKAAHRQIYYLNRL